MEVRGARGGARGGVARPVGEEARRIEREPFLDTPLYALTACTGRGMLEWLEHPLDPKGWVAVHGIELQLYAHGDPRLVRMRLYDSEQQGLADVDATFTNVSKLDAPAEGYAFGA